MTEQPSIELSAEVIRNIVRTLVLDWGVNVVRIPICGSGWLQDYKVKGYGGIQNPMGYRDWIDIAICEATKLGAVAIVDNHLWAIGKESNTTKNAGMEDGCTGINKVAGIDSCAPHDWYGQYFSGRTGQVYNTGDDPESWQCAIANADGCTLDNIFRNNNAEHFLNLWYELALRYKDNPYVWFELFNEPYQRQSADFGVNNGFGDNIPDSEYDWTRWSSLMHEAIKVIRDDVHAQNIVLVSGLDWGYDYLGDARASNNNTGPVLKPSLVSWQTYTNIAYSFHPYQHGACCGEIGTTEDKSVEDPYQSAFCMFPPMSGNNGAYNSNGGGSAPAPVASNSALPLANKMCDTTGYAITVNKKSPPCVWVPQARKPGNTTLGLCAGDRDECDFLTQEQCDQKNANLHEPTSGGWSKYVLPMQASFGPLIATEFGSFDCSSPFVSSFTKWARQFGVSYTAWALWPQNSGGPGAGACGYPSVMAPTNSDSDGFGKGANSCQTREGCAQLLKPLPFAGKVISDDIKQQ
jgi:hypothetical protein